MKHRNRVMAEGEAGDIQLHTRPQEHFIEAQIQENDTLQAISLRFHCPISELKRINHIHKDNEIYARRILKVPVTPFSVLTELLPQSEPVPSTSADISPVIPNSVQNSNQSDECNEIVLNSNIAPAVILYTDGDNFDPITEDTTLLPKKERLTVETVVVKELTSHGADFGLKWFHLVCLLLVLGVVTPLVYVMFFLEKHEHSDIAPLRTP